jgi:hypothetical protein
MALIKFIFRRTNGEIKGVFDSKLRSVVSYGEPFIEKEVVQIREELLNGGYELEGNNRIIYPKFMSYEVLEEKVMANSDILQKGLSIVASGDIDYLLANSPMPNILFPTMGGEVFWNDLASAKGWRVQQNVFTNHCRVLNPDNWRFAWGSEDNILRLFRLIIRYSDTTLSQEEKVQVGKQIQQAIASGNSAEGPAGVYR